MSSSSGSEQTTALLLVIIWPQYPSPLQLICKCPTNTQSQTWDGACTWANQIYKKNLEIEVDYKCQICQHTSMSSLYVNKGASMMFSSVNVLDSTSKWCPVTCAIWSQCLRFIDLFAIISRRGHESLKSSMVFFRSRKACQSFSALGSFRHL